MPVLGSRGGASSRGFGGFASLGYFIKKSLRFRSSATAYLNRTPASAGNRRTYTWSGWVKRGALSYGEATLFNAGTTGIGTNDTGFLGIRFTSGDKLDITTGVTDLRLTTQVFRDPAAWYHIVVAFDTTQATGANRVKVYVNGTQVTAYAGTDPTQNLDTAVNNNVLHEVGRTSWNSAGYFDGYIAEQNFIDGQQLTPSSFAKTDAVTGQWIPIKYTGTYGTNGFYLNFKDNSAATATALGKDYSGNGNNWTPNNLSVTADTTYDSVTDSPSLSGSASNYCVLNPLSNNTGAPIFTINDGNLKYVCSASSGNAGKMAVMGSMGAVSGKYYWEIKPTGTTNLETGIAASLGIDGASPNATGSVMVQFYNGGQETYGTSATYSGTTPAYSVGNTLGIAFDSIAGTLGLYVNNTYFGAYTGIDTTKTWLPIFTAAGSGSATNFTVNFGQQPFTYTPPSGYKALNTYNLP